MGLRVNRRALLVGVIAVLVSVLAFLLVPTITADLPAISTLGNVDESDLHKCLMYDPTYEPDPDDPNDHGVVLVATDVHIADSMFEQHPDWYPNVNALMKCESQIANYTGPAFQISGNDYPSTVNCVVALDPDNASSNYHPHYTTNWNQTISASGNVVLVCRFKK